MHERLEAWQSDRSEAYSLRIESGLRFAYMANCAFDLMQEAKVALKAASDNENTSDYRVGEIDEILEYATSDYEDFSRATGDLIGAGTGVTIEDLLEG